MTSQMENIETNVETSETETVPLSTTLYLRNGVGGSVERRQASIRERFEAFRASAEGVDGRVERWAQSVVTPVADGEAASAGAVETYRALAAAVTAAGGRLEPFFQVRDRRGGDVARRRRKNGEPQPVREVVTRVGARDPTRRRRTRRPRRTASGPRPCAR